MAKIRQIGDKAKIISRKKEDKDRESLLQAIADQSERQLSQWFDHHFKSLPAEAVEGLNMILRVLRANAQVTRTMWEEQR